VAQTRVEQNALDLVFGLFNMGEQDAWREQQNLESTSSSLEILRTLNISFAAGDYQPYCDSAQDYKSMQMQMADASLQVQDHDHQSLRCKHTESFLQKERVFIAQLIAKATEISPTIFGWLLRNFFLGILKRSYVLCILQIMAKKDLWT